MSVAGVQEENTAVTTHPPILIINDTQVFCSAPRGFSYVAHF